MMSEIQNKLTIAISSRALFDMRESNRVYEEHGLSAYRDFQIKHEEMPLEPGEAFGFVNKILNINELLGKPKVEVILLSRNSADTGLRIFNSIQAHGLDIVRAAFCGGASPYRYVQAFACDLFLSTHANDVAHALKSGVAAATLIASRSRANLSDKLKIAFDGDSVLFSDESERVYQSAGLSEFARIEQAAANKPLAGGPFKNFLAALQALQREFDEGDSPIQTALVTARSAPAHERVIRTLRSWDIHLNECLFLGGMDKTEFLRAFAADVYFDDQDHHVELAREHLPAGHVPHGVMNS
ncbi:MAG: 5'-nucleotidase [Pseudomonadales bacterium]|nr:5'-nucleotidase [Pseudomonadales bacterium]